MSISELISEFIEVKELDLTNNVIQIEKWLDELVTVKEQMARIAEPYDVAIAQLQKQKAQAIGNELPTAEQELTKYIKAETTYVAHSIKGAGLQAVWSKGRTSWDTTALVSLIPEIQDENLKHLFSKCQKTGDPSVSIRIVKKTVKKTEMIEETGNLF